MSTLTDVVLSTTLVRSDQLLYTEVDGDVTMMSVETGKYFSLTSTGARIWSLLEQPISPGQICQRLLEEYQVEPTRCEDEVLNVLRRMADEGVVTLAARESQPGESHG